MKISNGIFYKTHSVKILIGKMISSEKGNSIDMVRWHIKIEMQSEQANFLEQFTVSGLSVGSWVSNLLNQKILATEETDITSQFSNILYLEDASIPYVSDILMRILEKQISNNIMDGILTDISITSISINEIAN